MIHGQYVTVTKSGGWLSRVLPWTSGGDGATSAGPPMVPHAVLARQFSWLTI